MLEAIPSAGLPEWDEGPSSIETRSSRAKLAELASASGDGALVLDCRQRAALVVCAAICTERLRDPHPYRRLPEVFATATKAPTACCACGASSLAITFGNSRLVLRNKPN